MGLYKRKDSSLWWMSFTVDGKLYQRSTGLTDKRIAQKIYDAVKGKIAIGNWIPEAIEDEKKQYTFSDLVERYADYAPGRVRSWERSLKPVVGQLTKEFGDMYLDDITTHAVEAYQSQLIRRGLAVATVNKHMTILKMLIAKAVDWEMTKESILKNIRKVKALKGANRRLRYLSIDECQSLIKACEPHLAPIVIAAVNTGMRKGEILALKWNNIDLVHGFILLDKTKNGERREIPINQTLRETLQGVTRRLDISYVFYDSATGKPFHDIKRSFNTACRRAEIRDFHFHDLRHTFASHLVMAGIDLTTVKELLGHKDIKMTLRYAHLASSHKVEALRKFDDLLTSNSAKKSNLLRFHDGAMF